MLDVSMVPLLINSARIKYSVLDELFSQVKIQESFVNLYLDGYDILHKLYRSEYLSDIYQSDIDRFIKDCVISVVNTIGHYRRYFFTRMHKSNRIFLVFNRRRPSYQCSMVKDFGKTYYDKLLPVHFQYSTINVILEQAFEMIRDLCTYFTDVYVINNKKVEDYVTAAHLKLLYNGYNIYFTRNELFALLLDQSSCLIYPKRDDSKIAIEADYFFLFFSSVKYKPKFMTANYAKYYFCISGIKSRNVSGTCTKGTIKGAKIIDSMIEDECIDIHTSINRFIELLPKYLKRELTLEEEKQIRNIYNAIDVRPALAALTDAQTNRINNSLVNLYDQIGLEELNQEMANADDIIDISNLNMNQVQSYHSFWGSIADDQMLQ